MPITINGTGSITGISAGGLPDLSITTADIADNAVTYAKIGTTEQGQLCKAWVNFNGTTASPSTIRASYNVSSVTKNASGEYTMNFTTAMPDANYVLAGSAAYPTANSSHVIVFGTLSGASGALPTASGCRLSTIYGASQPQDCTYVTAAIFR